jgi:hypothetical protein
MNITFTKEGSVVLSYRGYELAEVEIYRQELKENVWEQRDNLK